MWTGRRGTQGGRDGKGEEGNVEGAREGEMGRHGVGMGRQRGGEGARGGGISQMDMTGCGGGHGL